MINIMLLSLKLTLETRKTGGVDCVRVVATAVLTPVVTIGPFKFNKP